MYEKLKQQILPQLIPPQSRILVAVSGGPDSVALGHILWRYTNESKDRGLSLVMTHVHHGVRQESDEEEKMVEKLARDWGISCLVHRFDAKSYAKSSGQSFETAAREWRYARWKEDMQQEECTLLATAHHLGDQAETVLYRLIRGSGAAGLAGIYPRKGEVIHPLLSVFKEEILQYCQKEQLPFAFDCSNADPVYVRNKIRLELLPELERNYNPRVKEALGRMAELLRWDEEYLAEDAEKVWGRYALEGSSGQIGLRHEVFQVPKAIQSRLIRKVVCQISGEPRGIGYSYVGQIMDSGGQVGWSQDLPGLKVDIDYKGIWFKRPEEAVKSKSEHASAPLPQGVNFGDWLQWKDTLGQVWKIGLFEDESDGVFNPNGSPHEWAEIEKVYFDRKELEQNKDSLRWRKRQPRDSMWLSGLGHKTLKKIFQDGKIGKEARREIPLLACGEDVLWVPGVRVGDRYRAHSEEKVIGLLYECSNTYQMSKKKMGDSL